MTRRPWWSDPDEVYAVGCYLRLHPVFRGEWVERRKIVPCPKCDGTGRTHEEPLQSDRGEA